MKRNGILTLTVFVVFGTLAALNFPITHVRALQNSQIKLSLEAGYDSYYRTGEWLPLLIKVSNSGPDISGELRVTAGTTNGLAANAYASSIELPTQSNKQIFLNIQLMNAANQVQVELVDGSGVIATTTSNVRPAQPSDLIFAVVTDSPRGTIDLSTAKASNSDTYQANWRIDNIPTTAQGLEGLTALVLTDVDSGNLSNAQRQAIEDWVTSGGHLIVTGGPNWEKTQAGVTSLLPFAPGGTTTLASLPSIAAFSGRSGDKLTSKTNSPIIVTQGKLLPGTQILAQETDVPLLIRRPLGAGHVDYLAVDPGLEPYQSWTERSKFWLTLFNITSPTPSWAYGITSAQDAIQAADFIKGLRLPDILQLVAFLGIYITLIGPLNYLILRRLGRPEWAWFTIPVIVIGCSVIAYYTGFSLRGTRATINRLALVQVWPNSQRAQVDGVIGILAPRRSIYNITINNNMSLQVPQDNPLNGAPASLNLGASDMTIEQNVNYEARNVPVDAGTTAAFITRGYIQVPALQGQATIQLSTTSQTTNPGQPHVTGTVTNTTGVTLSDAVILVLGTHLELGTLLPNETRTFAVDVPFSQSMPTPLTSAIGKPYNPYPYNAYPYDNNPYRTLQDIMGSNFRADTRSITNSLQEQEMRRRENFLRALIANRDLYDGRGTNVYLAGWTDTAPFDVTLPDVSTVTEDSTLYIYRLPVTIKGSNSDSVEIPSAYLTWMPTERSTRTNDVAPYNLELRNGDEVVLRFTPLPAVKLDKVTEIRLDARGNGNQGSVGNGIISLWNWRDQKWEDMNITLNITKHITTDVERFIGPDNMVELQAKTATNTSYSYYQNISILLYGHLANTVSEGN